MSNIQSSLNSTPHLPEDYDVQVAKVIPYYSSLHQEVINLVKALPFTPDVWMDTGCGTGSLIKKAITEFPETKFLLLDPSEGMLQQAQVKLSSYATGRLEFMQPSPTQDFMWEHGEKPDVITAIQCHHYLCDEDRVKATKVCYDSLKERGVYITFENIRPLTEEGITVGKQYLGNFQLSMGKSQEEVDKHLARFDVEYFPITVEEHLRLLRETGFRIVEILWYSYMQAGFYCIK
jgi:tRNA (cmo5U34)-methyltransferase